MDVTIGVGTFGDQAWIDLARARAIPSAEQFGAPVIHHHSSSLHDARNAILEQATTEHLIYLDADDELEPGYIDAMATGTCDLRAPSLRQIRRRRIGQPFMPNVYGHHHACTAECLRHGNWMVIGTCARTELLRRAGGWEPWGWSEDWAMWARCWTIGGTVEAIPTAVYRAHVSMQSRNHALSPAETNDWHRQIEAAIWPAAA